VEKLNDEETMFWKEDKLKANFIDTDKELLGRYP
jgi:hypothetical protein